MSTDHLNHFTFQAGRRLSSILKASCPLHTRNGIALDLGFMRLLLQNGEQFMVRRIRPYAVNDWEREFDLGQIFAESFGLGVGSRLQIEVIIAHLEH